MGTGLCCPFAGYGGRYSPLGAISYGPFSLGQEPEVQPTLGWATTGGISGGLFLPQQSYYQAQPSMLGFLFGGTLISFAVFVFSLFEVKNEIKAILKKIETTKLVKIGDKIYTLGENIIIEFRDNNTVLINDIVYLKGDYNLLREAVFVKLATEKEKDEIDLLVE